MIDAACGLKPGDVERMGAERRRTAAKQPMPDAFAQALLAVADAAKAWAHCPTGAAEHTLEQAVAEWVRLGG